MPLNIVSEADLHRLYQKTINPFHGIGSNFDPETQRKFENITTECKYYTISVNGSEFDNVFSNKLSIIHLNVRSILNNEKFESFQTFLHSAGINWDIVCVSETWLNSDIENMRTIPGYTAFFESRRGKAGGGVAIYVRNSCIKSCTRIQMNVLEGTEALFIKCDLPCSKCSVYLCCILVL